MKHKVSVAESAEQFFCSEDQHLLQGMRTFHVGQPLLEVIPVGCRGGGCGICRIRILAGEYEAKKMSRKHIPENDQARGLALACRIYPRSDLQIEVLSLPEVQPQPQGQEDIS
jgi:ferredoxin